MRAIVYRRYGPPDVLQVEEVATPTPGPGEVRIRMHAAEATKADCELRSFRFPVKWFWLPLRLALGVTGPRRQILGAYFSGEVESVGDGVSRLSVGDQVYGSAGLRMGAYGEYACFPESCTIALKPTNMSFEEACTVPLGGLNALHFMNRAAIEPGEKVMVNGAGGSIGMFALQIAKHRGAEVTAVDHGRKEELIRRLGADHFIDYTRESFSRAGGIFDVVFDMVARSSYRDCVRVLRPGGRYLMGNPRLSDMIRAVLTSRFTDKTATFAFAGERLEELQTLARMIEDGVLRTEIDGVFAMEKVAEAHRRVETEQRIGAVVVKIESERPLSDGS